MARIENGGIVWWDIEWKEEGIACMCIQKPNPNMYSEKGRRGGKGEMARIENGGIVWQCIEWKVEVIPCICIQKPKPKVYPESQEARIKVETPGTLWQQQKVLEKPKPEMNREIYNAFFTRILQ